MALAEIVSRLRITVAHNVTVIHSTVTATVTVLTHWILFLVHMYVLSLGCCDLGVESLDSNSKREVNKNPVEPCVGATASATGSGSFSSSLRSSPIHPSLHRTTLQPTVDSLLFVLALFTLSQQSWGGRTCTCVLGLVMILFVLLISVMFCVPCSLV